MALMEVAVPRGCIVTPAVEPFQSIWAFAAKLLPVAVNVKASEPAEVNAGLIELNVGVEPPVLVFDHAVTKLKASIEPSPVA